MKKYFYLAKGMLLSGTAKDTFILFTGNVGSAFWSFLFTLFVARSLSIYDFGIFSAALNLVMILASIADIGISTGSVNFVSAHTARGEHEKADQYIKAAFVTRLLIVLAVSAVIIIFAPFISKTFLATRDPKIAIWSAIIPIFLFPDLFFPFILQAKKKFLHSTLIDNAFYFVRLLFAFAFYAVGALTMTKAFWAFGAGFVVSLLLILYYMKTGFLRAKPGKEEYKKLLNYVPLYWVPQTPWNSLPNYLFCN